VTALRAEAATKRARHRWRCLAIWIHNTAVRRVARFAWHAASVAAHQAAQRQFKASVEQWRASVEGMREQYQELLLAAQQAHERAYVLSAFFTRSKLDCPFDLWEVVRCQSLKATQTSSFMT
jgi:cytosine/adenosine deaminase-related metal-dependent hydrolase